MKKKEFSLLSLDVNDEEELYNINQNLKRLTEEIEYSFDKVYEAQENDDILCETETALIVNRMIESLESKLEILKKYKENIKDISLEEFEYLSSNYMYIER